MPHDIVVIRTLPTELEALVAQADLRAHGIPSMLMRDDAGGMQFALQFLHGVRLAVRGVDALAAIRVLDSAPGASAEAP
jgi:hypothetical protein